VLKICKLSYDVINLFRLKLFQNLFGDDRLLTSDVTTIKMVSLIPSFTFQIYMACYLFANLHSQVILN